MTVAIHCWNTGNIVSHLTTILCLYIMQMLGVSTHQNETIHELTGVPSHNRNSVASIQKSSSSSAGLTNTGYSRSECSSSWVGRSQSVRIIALRPNSLKSVTTCIRYKLLPTTLLQTRLHINNYIHTSQVGTPSVSCNRNAYPAK